MTRFNWQSARVAVTGGTGFLGSYVIDGLKARGAGAVFPLSSRDFDLVQPGAALKMLQGLKPTLVIHLAAKVGGILANQKNPGLFFYQNLMMGAQLIEAARETSLTKLVALGTICSYPKFAPVPFKEDGIWDGYPEETNAPYGLAKKMLLVQSQAYRAQYGLNSSVLFPVNLYGPRDNFDLESSHVIPALIRKMIEARGANAPEVLVWGDGSATREFLHARDAADGILLACERYDSSEPVNLGAGFEIKIKDLAELVQRLTGYQGQLRWDTSRPNGQPRRMLDVERAREQFGFTAKIGFEEGLLETIEWYRGHRGNSGHGSAK